MIEISKHHFKQRTFDTDKRYIDLKMLVQALTKFATYRDKRLDNKLFVLNSLVCLFNILLGASSSLYLQPCLLSLLKQSYHFVLKQQCFVAADLSLVNARVFVIYYSNSQCVLIISIVLEIVLKFSHLYFIELPAFFTHSNYVYFQSQ